MKCQIQVRGEWGGTAGDWRPLRVSGGTGDVCVFASWDEAEDVLERMQHAGLVPFWPEPGGAEFRIIDLAERRGRRRGANGPTSTPRVEVGRARSGAARPAGSLPIIAVGAVKTRS